MLLIHAKGRYGERQHRGTGDTAQRNWRRVKKKGGNIYLSILCHPPHLGKTRRGRYEGKRRPVTAVVGEQDFRFFGRRSGEGITESPQGRGPSPPWGNRRGTAAPGTAAGGRAAKGGPVGKGRRPGGQKRGTGGLAGSGREEGPSAGLSARGVGRALTSRVDTVLVNRSSPSSSSSKSAARASPSGGGSLSVAILSSSRGPRSHVTAGPPLPTRDWGRGAAVVGLCWVSLLGAAGCSLPCAGSRCDGFSPLTTAAYHRLGGTWRSFTSVHGGCWIKNWFSARKLLTAMFEVRYSLGMRVRSIKPHSCRAVWSGAVMFTTAEVTCLVQIKYLQAHSLNYYFRIAFLPFLHL